MEFGIPTAVVNGVHRFGAKKLIEELVKNDLQVVGVGEYVTGLNDIKGFTYSSENDALNRADYVFDFVGECELWRKAEKWGSKLVLIEINGRTGDEKQELIGMGVDWRLVRAFGVYGEGMMENDECRVGIENLTDVMWDAVKNKTLEMPSVGGWRLLAVTDVAEVVLRAVFLSGTRGEVIDVWGAETSYQEIAEVLIEEAKMTRKKVKVVDLMDRELDEAEVLKNWEKIRWQPRVCFREGVREALQYMFRVVEEESRRSKPLRPSTSSGHHPLTGEATKKGRFEVVVESDNDKLLITNYELKKQKSIEEEENSDQLRVDSYELKNKEKENHKDNYNLRVEPEELREKIELEPIRVVAGKSPLPERPMNTELVKSERLEEKESSVVETVQIEPKKIPKVKMWTRWRINQKLGWWVGGAGVVLGVLIGWVVADHYLMFRSSGRLMALAEQGKYDEITKELKKLDKKMSGWESVVLLMGGENTGVGRNYLAGVKVGKGVIDLGEQSVRVAKRAETVFEGVLTDKTVDMKGGLVELEKEIAESEEKAALLAARMAGNWSWLPGRYKGEWQKWGLGVNQYRSVLSDARKVVEMLPLMVGVSQERKDYLVLMQNENELRPGGGFVGSYATVSFSKGKLVDFVVRDVYETDGQLKGHVEPPEPIKKYLGEAGWFLRDANWSADFGKNSKDVQWFFEKQTGRKIDGVIGINLAVAKAMVEVVGEVFVPDFREKVNSTNMYERAEYYSEAGTFPGSTQKASFLGGLSKQLFEEIKVLTPEKQAGLAVAMLEMLNKNEIQMAFNDRGLAERVMQAGWDGGIYQGRCAQERCFADYLYVVEANMGVNKVNYFLGRSMEQLIEIGENEIRRKLRIEYENRSKSNTQPGGDYKNYLRLYIPETAKLEGIAIEKEGGQSSVVALEEVDQKNWMGKKEVGLLVVVPVGKKRVIEVRYSDRITIGGGSKFSYLNYIQKQSGFGDTGMVSLVSMPEGWQVAQVEPEAVMVKGKILFNQKLTKDLRMGVEIVK